tara:strand:+ start:1330 stop:2532 length:1203 start_codon:yes stop_codon:yes gene_type:complete
MDMTTTHAPIYLDYAASTPLSADVADAMYRAMTDPMMNGNPSSNTHEYGSRAQEAVLHARQQVAGLIGASWREIVFTSGATESNNIILQGVVKHFKDNNPAHTPCHLITSAIEHKAVLSVMQSLAEQDDVFLTVLTPDENGLITADAVEDAMTPNTVLVSIMHVNNEVGNINPVMEIGKLCEKRNVLFHVDASQSVGKLPVDVEQMGANFVSFSAHKMYGPRGAGALYFNLANRRDFSPLMQGGDQERTIRPGTLATHQIVGFGKAADIASRQLPAHLEYAQNIKAVFLDTLRKHNVEIELNSNLGCSSPFILNLRFLGVESDTLMMACADKVAFSTGSACNSANKTDSYVLHALYPDRQNTGSDARFSFSHLSTVDDVRQAAEYLAEKIALIISINMCE